MRRIALFLLSSILTPATLAAGQTTCVLATQIQVITPLPAGDSAGFIVVSNRSGSCFARSIATPLRPAVSQQRAAQPVAKSRLSTAAFVENLLSKLGWDSSGKGMVSAVSSRMQTTSGLAGASGVAGGFDPRLTFVGPERVESAVLRF